MKRNCGAAQSVKPSGRSRRGIAIELKVADDAYGLDSLKFQARLRLGRGQDAAALYVHSAAGRYRSY